MKKLFCMVLWLGVMVCVASAATLPPMNAGAYYSFKDHALNTVGTVEAVKIKDLVAIELGVAGDADESDWKGVAAISLDIKQLKLGNYVSLPVLDLVAFRPAVFVGLGSINSKDLSGAKLDYGLGATFVSLKW